MLLTISILLVPILLVVFLVNSLRKSVIKSNNTTETVYDEFLKRARKIKTVEEAEKCFEDILEYAYAKPTKFEKKMLGISDTGYFYNAGPFYKEKFAKLLNEINGIIYYLSHNKVYAKDQVIGFLKDLRNQLCPINEREIEITNRFIKENLS